MRTSRRYGLSHVSPPEVDALHPPLPFTLTLVFTFLIIGTKLCCLEPPYWPVVLVVQAGTSIDSSSLVWSTSTPRATRTAPQIWHSVTSTATLSSATVKWIFQRLPLLKIRRRTRFSIKWQTILSHGRMSRSERVLNLSRHQPAHWSSKLPASQLSGIHLPTLRYARAPSPVPQQPATSRTIHTRIGAAPATSSLAVRSRYRTISNKHRPTITTVTSAFAYSRTAMV